MTRWWGALAALAALALGCLDAPPTDGAGGQTPDAAMGGATDAGGPADAGGTPDSGLVCEQPPPPNGGDCPSQCKDCLANVCSVDCSGPGCAGTIDCPEGFECQVDCPDDDSCMGVTVNCPSLYECHLTCAGDNACQGLIFNCGDGPCYISCIGDLQSCRNTFVQCGPGECQAYCPNAGAVLPTVDCGPSCQCTKC